MQAIVWALALAALSAEGDTAEARDIIERAIQAHGGEVNLAKMKTMRIKVEGTLALPVNVPVGRGQFVVRPQPAPFSREETWQALDRYKDIRILQLPPHRANASITVTVEEKGWRQHTHAVNDIGKEEVAEIRQHRYAQGLERLHFLKEKDYDVSYLEEVKIDSRPAAGVLVKSKGQPDVRLYFDKESGLLIGREYGCRRQSEQGHLRPAVERGRLRLGYLHPER